MLEAKIDPFTGELFEPKRRNQVFATLKNKTEFHNEKARLEYQIKKPILKTIEKNYSILKSKLGDHDSMEVSKIEMQREGFNFTIFTSFRIEEKNQWLIVYNIMFLILNERTKIIIKKDDKYGLLRK